MLADGFGWIQGGFQRFTVLVPTVKLVALNLKDVDNCGKFLYCLAKMMVKFP